MILENKVAIVTGGGMGIGRATAFAYSSEGAKVVVADINVQAGMEVVSEINKNGREAIFVKTDVTNPAAHEALIRAKN